MSLTDFSCDTTIKELETRLLPIAVSLSSWIEERIVADLETLHFQQSSGGSSCYVGLPGTLDAEAITSAVQREAQEQSHQGGPVAPSRSRSRSPRHAALQQLSAPAQPRPASRGWGS